MGSVFVLRRAVPHAEIWIKSFCRFLVVSVMLIALFAAICVYVLQEIT